MDLVQLEYFRAVAESGHLTNAAKKLNVAQPALSVSIARLENEVGVPLFDRVGRGIYLNKCGEIYLEYVEQALSIMKRAQNEVDSYCEKLENVLNLGIVSKPFSQMMLVGFKEQCPSCRVRQIDISSDSIEEELNKGEVDFVIGSRLSSAPGIVGEVIREEKMYLAVSAENPLAKYDWIRLIDARDEAFVSLPKEYEYRMMLEDMCQECGFTPKVAVECFHCHMTEMVASGADVAVMTEDRAVKNKGNKQLVFLPIMDPEYTRKHYIMWKAGHHFNRVSRDFRKYLREYFEQHESSVCDDCGI